MWPVREVPRQRRADWRVETKGTLRQRRRAEGRRWRAGEMETEGGGGLIETEGGGGGAMDAEQRREARDGWGCDEGRRDGDGRMDEEAGWRLGACE